MVFLHYQYKNTINVISGKESKLKKQRSLFYFFSKTRISYLFTKFTSFLKLWISKNIVLLPPTTLMVEPTNLCNLKCPLCPTGLGTLNRDKRTMTYENFKYVIDQTHRYVREIILWNYGEPFINKNILPMISYATHKKIDIITSTNGHFFHSLDYCKEIVKSGLHRVIVAIDGATQESYEKYRVGGDLQKVIQGVKWLVEAKKILKSKVPFIELQFILMKHNVHQKEEMKKLAEGLKVDLYVEKEVGIHPDERRMFDLRHEFLPDHAKDHYFLNDKGEIQIQGEVPNFCDWPYRYAVVNADGNLVPCCNDIDSHYVMGNLFKEDLLTIWRNEKYQKFRDAIRRNRKEVEICRTCPHLVEFKDTPKNSQEKNIENPAGAV